MRRTFEIQVPELRLPVPPTPTDASPTSPLSRLLPSILQRTTLSEREDALATGLSVPPVSPRRRHSWICSA
ncbi:UNVERIFIED_CONTAM: hypothetical protein PYX00_005023 [Menopon gallinae]|uniref:Uncharacterized protein n=1 Tax=Menopon gallinae TaxID=328185 RepID=A0AAW2I6Z0_9NEOP